MTTQQDQVLQALDEQDVRLVRLWFTDVTGALKSIAIAPAEAESAMREGFGIDGSAIEGATRLQESDVVAKADPSTFKLLPEDRGEGQVARMFCDIFTPDGQPAAFDPRQVLKRAIAAAADRGFTFTTHPEIEFYLLRGVEDGVPVPVDRAGYYDHVAGGTAHDFRRLSVQRLEELGIAVEFSHHEGGPGQNEIDLRYADALTTSDNIMTFRAVAKEIALEQGVIATFMPKPFSDQPGSGMHTHLSLFEGETNAFFEAGAQYRLSRVGRQFVAGLLKHAPEFTAVTNQFVNSYKRIWAGDEAPAYISWGHLNRSALVRVPLSKPGKASSARVEYRALDSAANPYLAYACLLMAGLKGIEEGYELADEAVEDVQGLTRLERRAMGLEPLPESLHSAIERMEDSELVAETLGEQLFQFYLRNKQEEWRAYRSHVSRWELDSTLESL